MSTDATLYVAPAESARLSFLRRLSSAQTLLAGGITLRILVFIVLAPLNNDTGHLDVIRYIVQRHALPPAGAMQMSFQPPLYYLLAAPLYYLSGNAKDVQVLSLLLSILTLLMFYRLLYHENLMAGEKPRLFVFMLVCFLPQFVLFGLFVSNDTLAIFLGALMILQVVRFVREPNSRQLALLALLMGLGLLTKATFLAFLPVLFALLLFVRLRAGSSAPKAFLTALALLLLSCGLGCFKFVRNYQEVGKPFISDLDFQYSWVAKQQQSYRGAASFLDINLWKLLASPTLDPRIPSVTPSPTESSYPLLLYGSFWYPHIQESNFAVSSSLFNRLGSVIYALALLPVATFLIGLFLLLKGLPRFLARFDLSRQEDQDRLVSFVSVFCVAGNLALLLVVTLKYHVWSVMTGRLLFPAFFGLLAPFGVGAGMVARCKVAHIALKLAMVALAVCFAIYFAAEIIHRSLNYGCFGSPYCG